MRKLQESLKICEMREQTALKENERYSSVNGSLEEKLRSLGCQLQEVRKESEFRQEKWANISGMVILLLIIYSQ